MLNDGKITWRRQLLFYFYLFNILLFDSIIDFFWLYILIKKKIMKDACVIRISETKKDWFCKLNLLLIWLSKRLRCLCNERCKGVGCTFI